MRGYTYVRDDCEVWLMLPGNEAPVLTLDEGQMLRLQAEFSQKLASKYDQDPDRSRG